MPHEKQFLANYFKTPTERLFLSYYLHFNIIIEEYNVRTLYNNFIDHTGYYCSEQWFHFLLKRIDGILIELKTAEKKMDLDAIEEIKTGKKKCKAYRAGSGN